MTSEALLDRWLALDPASLRQAVELELAEVTPPGRLALVELLKARIDGAVRTSPPSALPLSDLLLCLEPHAPEGRALIQRGRAVALHANGRSDEAVVHYLAAIEAYSRGGEALECARVRRSLVDVLQMSGRSAEALSEAELARVVFEAQGESRLLAQLECNVGNVHFRLDRFQRALEAYERAIRIFDGIGDSFGRAFARYNAGNVLTNMHRFEPAQEAFVEARASFVENGHSVLAADAEYALAYLDFRRGRWTEAIEAFERAKAAYLCGGKPSGAWLCELDLAELHLQLGADHDAERHAALAADGFAGLGMRYELAKAQLFEGVACSRRGEIARGERALHAAQDGFEALGNDTRRALVVLQRAELQRAAVRHIEAPQGGPTALGAIGEVQRACLALERSGDVFLARFGRLALADAQLAAGLHDAARVSLVVLLAEVGSDKGNPLDTALEIGVRRSLAEAAESRADAREQLQRAIEALEETYTGLAFRDARLMFFGARQGVYTRLAALLLEDGGNVEDAIECAERGRQRSRLERPLGAALADPELAAARAELDGWIGARLDSSLGGGHAAARARVTQTVHLEARQHELLRRARRQLRSAPHLERGSATATELREDEALLYFIVDGQAVHAVLRRGGEALTWRAHVTASALIELSERFRYRAAKARFGSTYRARHAAASERAASTLLTELGGVLAGCERALDELAGAALRIVPYGVLHDLPLHAAVSGGRALFERCAVSYSRGLAALEHAGRSLQPRAQRPADLSPSVRGNARRVVACIDQATDLPALVTELAGLREVYGAALELVEHGDLLARLVDGPPVAVLHLAAHGSFQPEHPLFSGLGFGARSLTALDVERLQLDGAVVTLSGCETSRQTVGRAEDPLGPERSFLVAGASAVLGSLWPVEDRATAELMVEFHAALARELDTTVTERAASGAVQRAYCAALRSDRVGAGRHLIDAAAWVLAEAPTRAVARARSAVGSPVRGPL